MEKITDYLYCAAMLSICLWCLFAWVNLILIAFRP